MKKLLIIPFIAALLLSCNKQDIPTYSGDYYANFVKDSSDVTKFTFITRPGTTSALVALPIELIGKRPSTDVSYTVSIVKTGKYATTATADSYALPTKTVFRASHYAATGVVDTLYVKVNKIDILNTKELTLTLKIENSTMSQQGLQNKIVNVIQFGNIKSRPSWWTEEFAKAFLGNYSDAKYDEFIKCTLQFNPDFDFGAVDKLSVYDLQAYCRNFVYYLRKLKDEGKEVMENGQPMLDGINIIA